jgi:two-component system KDP operon response regulator KdpE
VKVLIVEADAVLARTLASNLRARNHEVAVQETAESAIVSMMEDWPDALVVEVNLPDASGWTLLRSLSQEDRDQMHVIVVSSAPISQIRVVEFKPAHTFQKPFALKAFINAIEDASDEDRRVMLSTSSEPSDVSSRTNQEARR